MAVREGCETDSGSKELGKRGLGRLHKITKRRRLGADRGVHPSETMVHFPLCFRFPPISDKFFRLRGKFSQFYPFSKNFHFHLSAKISDAFF